MFLMSEPAASAQLPASLPAGILTLLQRNGSVDAESGGAKDTNKISMKSEDNGIVKDVLDVILYTKFLGIPSNCTIACNSCQYKYRGISGKSVILASIYTGNL
jgi:hypothetical protein